MSKSRVKVLVPRRSCRKRRAKHAEGTPGSSSLPLTGAPDSTLPAPIHESAKDETPERRVVCPKCHLINSMAYVKCQDRTCQTPLPPRPNWYLEPTSLQREQANKVAAMRIAGADDETIATTLGLAKQTVHNVIYKAARNGWMNFDDPKDVIDYQLIPKAIRVMDEGLADETRNEKTGVQVRQLIAMKIGADTIFKRYDTPTGNQNHQTMIGIRIEMPTGPAPAVREGTTAGTPAYIEAEVGK